MSDITAILSGIEGLAPEAIAAIEGYVKNEEAKLVSSLEEKYGVKPSVISDVTALAEDVAPAAETEVKSVTGVDVASLLARLSSLEQQNAQLQAQAANPSQEISAGSGEPVPHNLFLSDGSVITNHAGLATQISTTNADGSETVRKVVAAYPA